MILPKQSAKITYRKLNLLRFAILVVFRLLLIIDNNAVRLSRLKTFAASIA